MNRASRATRRLLRSALPVVLSLLAFGSALAQEPAPEVARPEPVGDLGFVNNGRLAGESRYGLGIARTRLGGQDLERDSYMAYVGFELEASLVRLGDAAAIVLPFRVALDLGYTDAADGDDVLGLAFGAEGTIGAGLRVDLGYEHTLRVWGTYSFQMQTAATYPSESFAALWNLGYVEAAWRWKRVGVAGGVGFGAGGMHFRANARLLLGQYWWVVAELSGLVSPSNDDPMEGGRQVYVGRLFLAKRFDG